MRLFEGRKHRRWQEELSAYIDGHLVPRKQEELQRHLAECSSCQQELEELQGVVALLRRVPMVSVPRSFTLSQAPARIIWWDVRYAAPLRYSTAVVAFLLLAVVVGDLLTVQRSVVTPEAPATLELQEDEGAVAPMQAPAPTMEAIVPEGEPAPGSVPAPQPAAARAAEGTPEDAPASEEPDNGDTLFFWAEVALGVLLAVVATLVAVQLWLRRRLGTG